MELKDKVAVVTGASSGLGLAFARALMGKEAHVYGLARRLDRMKKIRGELGERFHPIECDVTDQDQVQSAFQVILDERGRVDVLINNAGVGKYAPVDELDVETWDLQMETNLRGVFLCTHAAVPQMKRQNEASGFGGYIINIASIAGLLGNPSLSAYNASKFGVRGFSDSIMKELRQDGIKVTCVYPGSVDTDFSSISGSRGAPNAMLPEDLSSTVIHLLETRDNYLISEVVMRPLRPKG